MSTCRQSLSRLLRARRSFWSSSGNPMFPEREVVAPKPIQIDPKNLPDNLKGGPDEFLGLHGGKIAAVGFTLAGFLVYRYFKSSSDKDVVVENLHAQSPLEPYEANEIRLGNDLTRDDFKLLVKSFEAELRGKESMSYEAFVSKVDNVINKKIVGGHLLDRVMYKYFEFAKTDEARSTLESSYCPVDFALTVFNLTMHSPPVDRIEVLFDVGRLLDRQKDTEGDGEKKIAIGSAQRIVENLALSWQIPNDVRVLEIEDDYIPFRKFRVKTSQEMVESYLVQEKLAMDESQTELSLEQFQKLILSRYVCAWAECKRASS